MPRSLSQAEGSSGVHRDRRSNNFASLLTLIFFQSSAVPDHFHAGTSQLCLLCLGLAGCLLSTGFQLIYHILRNASLCFPVHSICPIVLGKIQIRLLLTSRPFKLAYTSSIADHFKAPALLV